jgi:hypothetical protein
MFFCTLCDFAERSHRQCRWTNFSRERTWRGYWNCCCCLGVQVPGSWLLLMQWLEGRSLSSEIALDLQGYNPAQWNYVVHLLHDAEFILPNLYLSQKVFRLFLFTSVALRNVDELLAHYTALYISEDTYCFVLSIAPGVTREVPAWRIGSGLLISVQERRVACQCLSWMTCISEIAWA